MRSAIKERGAALRRVGRPPTELAGEVEARILDAAAQVFLERGFAGASIDAIADAARAGKPTIYARYPDKEALFEAAFLRRLEARNARLETYAPRGDTVEERLVNVGVAMVDECLTEDFIGLVRLAIAESRRLPELVGRLLRESRERGIRTTTRLLVESLGEHLGDDARTARAAQAFAEGVLPFYLLRALGAENLAALRAEAPDYIRVRARLFLAAVRCGGLS